MSSTTQDVKSAATPGPSQVLKAFQATPASLIPLLLGLAALLAMFVGFGMQFFLISNGTASQKKIDVLQGQSLQTILAVALLSFLGLALYYAFNQVEKAFLYLFIFVMIQLMLLHVAIAVSLQQVEVVSQ